jgi:RNA polymerase sigma-70 factor (ECF subfamily)
MPTSRAPSLVQAFEEHVWDVHGFFAYRVARRIDAEDLTQQTFERAVRAWRDYDPGRAPLQTWLLTIARNLLIDHYRRDHSRSHASLDDEGFDERELPSVEPEPDLGLSPELASALTRLTDRERELIALRYGGDLPGRQIAALVGLTLPNVQQILSRALRKLRAELDQEPSGPAPSAPSAATSRSTRPDPT